MQKKKSHDENAERSEYLTRPTEGSFQGSIEQQLDMNESGPLRGDELLRHPTDSLKFNPGRSGDPVELVEAFESFDVTMSEQDREGDDLSGDEHSSGLQGEESTSEQQSHVDMGMPGESARHQDQLEQGQIESDPMRNIFNIHSSERKARKKKEA